VYKENARCNDYYRCNGNLSNFALRNYYPNIPLDISRILFFVLQCLNDVAEDSPARPVTGFVTQFPD
jgi:hypothetical protein